jgi:hypothetical protein
MVQWNRPKQSWIETSETMSQNKYFSLFSWCYGYASQKTHMFKARLTIGGFNHWKVIGLKGLWYYWAEVEMRSWLGNRSLWVYLSGGTACLWPFSLFLLATVRGTASSATYSHHDVLPYLRPKTMDSSWTWTEAFENTGKNKYFFFLSDLWQVFCHSN